MAMKSKDLTGAAPAAETPESADARETAVELVDQVAAVSYNADGTPAQTPGFVQLPAPPTVD